MAILELASSLGSIMHRPRTKGTLGPAVGGVWGGWVGVEMGSGVSG